MNRWRFSPFRVRLLLLVLLAFLPATGLILYTAWEQRRQAALRVQESALWLAAVASSDHQRLVEGARQLLTGLARLPEVRRRESRACSVLFRDLLAQYRVYANLGAIDSRGEVFCSGLPLSGPLSLADRLYFREAVRTGTFAVGEYQVGRITGPASVNFGQPVLDAEGRVQAVVFAALDLGSVNELAARARLPEGSTLTVIDRAGIVLARYPEPERWLGKPAPEEEIVRIVLTQGEGVAEARGAGGAPSLFGFTPLGGSPGSGAVYVSVGIPAATAYAEANRALARDLLGLAIVAAVVLLATRLFSERFILRPVNLLLGVAERLKGGDLRARSGPPYGPGELGGLEQTFDDMAEALEVRHTQILHAREELGKANRALRVLSAASRALVRATEEGELIRSVCGVVVEAGGYRMAWVGFAEEDESKRVRPVAWAGHEEGYLGAIRVTWADVEEGRGPVGTAIRTGTPRVVQHIPSDPAFAPWRAEAARRGYGAMIALPLLAAGGPFGALAIYAAEPDAFDAEEVKLLAELGDDLAYGIGALRSGAERARAEEEVERQREALFRSEKLAALGRLAAGVAHELKNPLAVVAGRVRLLQMELAAGKPAEGLSRHAVSLADAAERMRRIVEGLSAYSKPPKPQPTLLEVGGLFRDTKEVVAYEARKRDVEIEVDVPGPSPAVLGDRSQFMQILVNLATNAIEAMAEAKSRRLRLSARLEGEGGQATVRIEVADTGPGIPAEALERIWEAFYTTKPEGTGLGLSIVRGLVAEQPGATIEVQSAPGQGTTFVLTLPAVPTALS